MEKGGGIYVERYRGSRMEKEAKGNLLEHGGNAGEKWGGTTAGGRRDSVTYRERNLGKKRSGGGSSEEKLRWGGGPSKLLKIGESFKKKKEAQNRGEDLCFRACVKHSERGDRQKKKALSTRKNIPTPEERIQISGMEKAKLATRIYQWGEVGSESERPRDSRPNSCHSTFQREVWVMAKE